MKRRRVDIQQMVLESSRKNQQLNSNDENDKKPAKEKDTSTVPLSVLYRTYWNGKNVVSNGINFYRGFIYKGSAIEEVFEMLVILHRITLAMSLFDLQDVRIAIGSTATLDLPMVVDLIGIYGLKGPYRRLTTTNWFLQALSVIPRGSWGDVARRSYHDSLGKSEIVIPGPQWFTKTRRRSPLYKPPPPPPLFAGKLFPANLDEENPSVQISSGLLVQADEGIPSPIVDLIDDIYSRLP
ncbi:U-box domain-containing protein 33-like [Dorcoceras hygrometricum]|uniref:U-box domain-containing protein 33-like n=1 Tax=Dorcoceras hygrometricum TaxID=472368 RepID=A0A2Z7CVW7_9LAMI|nr:U-box domain-containing protein 33-like [Dorcoceras hygrometricum]